jgi:hypothetical protein
MIEALATKHYVSATGEYLGGFGGVRRTTETPNLREVVVVDPDTGEESRHIEQDPPTITVSEEWPPVPAGSVEVPLPPASQLDRFDGMSWVAPAAEVVAADNLELARARISPEMMALIDALAGRLSIPSLREDVASRLSSR